MNQQTHKAWRQYEAGKRHKHRIGLYETARRNEAFYRGEQWQNGEGANLPKPVFNIIRRVIDYLVSSVASADLSVRFTDEDQPYASEADKKLSEELLSTLTMNTAFRWESCDMDSKLTGLLTDAAICGDGALYCWWDTEARGAGDYSGDIVTELIDAVNIFPADVNRPDIQSQEYIIISGRSSVASLRAEAAASGVSEEDIKKIVSDAEGVYQSGNMAGYELDGEDEAKATFIIKFWRENGRVCFEKSVKECIIRRARTECRLYPLAYLSWINTKNSFHGTSPVTSMIPNQKFINRAYAMAMKHMTDTAFSKVIYDKSKIPEWSNEVGEAIAAVGGGNISDAVSVVGTGEMQSGFVELIDSAVMLTKEVMGATESALGNLEAKNTSAILALQETSRITLDNVRRAFYKCVESLADVWTDMMCAYYPQDRLVPCRGEDGVSVRSVDPAHIRRSLISARVDVAEITRYSAVNAQNMLDKLLDGGHITPVEYIRRLPVGLVMDRQALIEEIEKRTEHQKEEIYGA
ncbi:MAG: hypothetical protein J6B72_03720 [Clostridia bacterium]|nr:hypothetical protein [Clostridia bacterium]